MPPDDAAESAERDGVNPYSNSAARLRRHQSYEAAYETWVESLPESERARLNDLGLLKPVPEQFGKIAGVDDDELEREIEDEGLPTPEEERELQDAISRALLWCVQGRTIVEVGQRWLAVMYIWRSALIAGMTVEIDREMAAEAIREVGDDDSKGGSEFVLEWGVRGNRLSQIGQRVMAIAYVQLPAAIGDATLAAIGAICGNKTRQAIDKLVQDFRDTFGGMRSSMMRDDNHRLTCKKSQLQRTSLA